MARRPQLVDQSVIMLAGEVAERTRSANDAEALDYIRRLNALFDRHGTSLRTMVINWLQLQSERRVSASAPSAYSWIADIKPPKGAMDQKNYAGWIRFMRAQTDPDHCLSAFERDVCRTIMHRGPPSEKQRTILWRALDRIADVGCGNWGRPRI